MPLGRCFPYSFRAADESRALWPESFILLVDFLLDCYGTLKA